MDRLGRRLEPPLVERTAQALGDPPGRGVRRGRAGADPLLPALDALRRRPPERPLREVGRLRGREPRGEANGRVNQQRPPPVAHGRPPGPLIEPPRPGRIVPLRLEAIHPRRVRAARAVRDGYRRGSRQTGLGVRLATPLLRPGKGGSQRVRKGAPEPCPPKPVPVRPVDLRGDEPRTFPSRLRRSRSPANGPDRVLHPIRNSDFKPGHYPQPARLDKMAVRRADRVAVDVARGDAAPPPALKRPVQADYHRRAGRDKGAEQFREQQARDREARPAPAVQHPMVGREARRRAEAGRTQGRRDGARPPCASSAPATSTSARRHVRPPNAGHRGASQARAAMYGLSGIAAPRGSTKPQHQTLPRPRRGRPPCVTTDPQGPKSS